MSETKVIEDTQLKPGDVILFATKTKRLVVHADGMMSLQRLRVIPESGASQKGDRE